MQKAFYAEDFTTGQIFDLGQKNNARNEIIEFAKTLTRYRNTNGVIFS